MLDFFRYLFQSDYSLAFHRYFIFVNFLLSGAFMERIAIIGSPGAGKTTLARNLPAILKIG